MYIFGNAVNPEMTARLLSFLALLLSPRWPQPQDPAIRRRSRKPTSLSQPNQPRFPAARQGESPAPHGAERSRDPPPLPPISLPPPRLSPRHLLPFPRPQSNAGAGFRRRGGHRSGEATSCFSRRRRDQQEGTAGVLLASRGGGVEGGGRRGGQRWKPPPPRTKSRDNRADWEGRHAAPKSKTCRSFPKGKTLRRRKVKKKTHKALQWIFELPGFSASDPPNVSMGSRLS